jgi:hypothetical protein
MKLKNQIFANWFSKALNNLLDEKLEIKISYNLTKFAKEIDSKFKIYDELRIKLCEKHWKINKKTNKYDLDNIEEFNKEFTELSDIEEEYTIEPIKLNEKVEISWNDLLLLEKILIME